MATNHRSLLSQAGEYVERALTDADRARIRERDADRLRAIRNGVLLNEISIRWEEDPEFLSGTLARLATLIDKRPTARRITREILGRPLSRRHGERNAERNDEIVSEIMVFRGVEQERTGRKIALRLVYPRMAKRYNLSVHTIELLWKELKKKRSVQAHTPPIYRRGLD